VRPCQRLRLSDPSIYCQIRPLFQLDSSIYCQIRPFIPVRSVHLFERLDARALLREAWLVRPRQRLRLSDPSIYCQIRPFIPVRFIHLLSDRSIYSCQIRLFIYQIRPFIERLDARALLREARLVRPRHLLRLGDL